MRTKVKIIFGGLLLIALCALVLPRMARRIDSAVAPRFEKAAEMEAQYRDMTNAYPIASEMSSDHPMRRLHEDRKAALLSAGYIEARELRMKKPLSRRSVNGFFTSFHSNFPGVQLSVRSPNQDEGPIVTVTARKSDFGRFGPIEQFITQYEEKSGAK